MATAIADEAKPLAIADGAAALNEQLALQAEQQKVTPKNIVHAFVAAQKWRKKAQAAHQEPPQPAAPKPPSAAAVLQAGGFAKRWQKQTQRAKVKRAVGALEHLTPDAILLRQLKAEQAEQLRQQSVLGSRVKLMEDLCHAVHPAKPTDWKPPAERYNLSTEEPQRVPFMDFHAGSWAGEYDEDNHYNCRLQYVEKSQQKWNDRYIAQHERHRKHQGEAFPYMMWLAGLD